MQGPDGTPLSKTLTTVLENFIQREATGLRKYGTTVDRDDLTPEEWVKHHEEELMDAILYNRRQFQELLAYKRASTELVERLNKLAHKKRRFEEAYQLEHALKEELFQYRVDLAMYRTRIDG